MAFSLKHSRVLDQLPSGRQAGRQASVTLKWQSKPPQVPSATRRIVVILVVLRRSLRSDAEFASPTLVLLVGLRRSVDEFAR